MGEQPVNFFLDRNAKELRVEEDLELEGIVDSSPAIAWEHSGAQGISVEVNREVGVSDA